TDYQRANHEKIHTKLLCMFPVSSAGCHLPGWGQRGRASPLTGKYRSGWYEGRHKNGIKK
ncbi:MAG TPA: hypothetical protein H9991_12060, partial [Candidatus Mailhella excrementigallinarum]|nr:hypothetical protein [Candidatus Mailhella excrementigallinarum]